MVKSASAMPNSLFHNGSIVAERQPKTDRLILARLLDEAALHTRLDHMERTSIPDAHAILMKWADLESSGRLPKLNETQMQGDFLTEVFGKALGYVGPLDGEPTWHREQHPRIEGETPDGVLGHFSESSSQRRVIIELKGPTVHLDRDRSRGRTAVEQCWGYLNNAPECRWGIVSNYVSVRLYERNSTRRKYEHFTLQSLRELDEFRRFYVLFHRQGLIENWDKGLPRALDLLNRSTDRQREVGDKLYDAYSESRSQLIAYLHFEMKHPQDEAIEMAQRLFDRIMFIAFCEDRRLLPQKTIHKAYNAGGFYRVTNPKWQSFKNLFHLVDRGDDQQSIPGYNGGLFAPHPVDDLELPDDPWTRFFDNISQYDFADEVNLDVLGHLFEKSITEIEKFKQSGLFGGNRDKVQEFARMPQSAKRKRLGIYYTPPELTGRIVQYAIEELIAERFTVTAVAHGVPEDDARRGVAPEDLAYWRQCLDILRNLKVLDPACGSGAFLFQAYNELEQRYSEVIGHLAKAGDGDAERLFEQIPHMILTHNLYGVDLSPEAVEITQLALWIRSATPGQTLATLSRNIMQGNSLVHDPEVDPLGFDWRARFPEVFDREESGFDCVIGNPPWERIKLQEREFFSLPAPEIATATNAAKRRKLVAKLESEDPALFARYQSALESAGSLLDYCRRSDAYPLTGKGDINTHAVFAELAHQLVGPHGRVGMLVPSGIASDSTTKNFFATLMDSKCLRRLYDFENKRVFFPDAHPSFRFCILNFGGNAVTVAETDFVFFIHQMEELEDRARHVPLSADDIRLLNPNTRTSPILCSRRDANVMKAIYRRVPILLDRNRQGPTGNPWTITFKTMFHQTNDAELFREPEWLTQKGYKLDTNRWKKARQVCLPVYEAKMFRPYDHRFGTVFEDTSNWINQGQTVETSVSQHMNPEFLVLPRWWVAESEVDVRLSPATAAVIGFRDVTRATDTRTFLATMLPRVGATNKVPLILTERSKTEELCLLANLNSIPLDFCTKQKFGGISLNFIIVEQVPVLPPDTYTKPCPWDRDTTLEAWISERVLKLTCTAEDMLPLAEACDFTGGSFQNEYGGRLNRWDEAERAELMAELDAAFFHLYGLDRDDVEYILSTFKGIHKERTLFPGHCSTAEFIVRKFSEMSFPG